MPVVTMPDGTPVNFPDQMPPAQIRALIAQKFPAAAKSAAAPAQPPQAASPSQTPQDKSWGQVGLGVAKNFIPGLWQFGKNAATAVWNLPETINSTAKIAFGEGENLADWATGGPYVNPDALPAWPQQAYKIANQYNQQKKQEFGSVAGFKNALSTDPVGTMMDMSILLGGVEGVGAKLPGLAGKAAETAGDVSRVINPVNAAAKGVGAVAKGAAAVLPKIPAAAPTIDALKNAARAAYATAEASGIVIKNDALKQMVANLSDNLKRIDPTLHPKATAALKRLNDAAQSGNDISLEDLDTLRQIAGDAASSVDKPDARLGYIIKDGIDDFVNGLDQNSVSGTLDPKGIEALSQARSYWTRQSKAEIIQGALDKAANRPVKQNLATALQTQFRRIANNQRAMARFSSQEQAAIKAVVQGGPAGKILQSVGLFAPTSLTGGMRAAAGGAVASVLGTPVAGAAVPVVGGIADGIAQALTRRNAVRASELVRGTPLPGVTATPGRLSIGLSGLGNTAGNVAASPLTRAAPIVSEIGVTQQLNANALARAKGLPLPYPNLQSPLPIGFSPPQ